MARPADSYPMLPAEIGAEVVSHLLYPLFHDFLSRHDDYADWDTFKYFGPPRDAWSAFVQATITTSFYKLEPDIRSLCNLRLVSRYWLTTVNAVWEKHIWWNVEVGSQEKLERVASACSPSSRDVLAFAGNPIKRISIPSIEDALAFERVFTFEYNETEEEILETIDKPISRWDHRYLLSENPFESSRERELIDQIFSRLDGIEALGVSFPVAESDYDNGTEGIATYYDMEVIDLCMAFFQNTLASPSFQYLTDLTLDLPCTYHVGEFAKGLDQQARDRLLHLKIGIKDCTGDVGCRDHLQIRESGEPGERDGDVQRPNTYPFSNVQRQFPNQGCQDAMWDFVASCPNLLSLCIEATQFLDLDRMDWKKSPNSRGLRVLSLDRVWVSVSSVKSLLQPHSTSSAAPALRRINFHEVKMHTEGGNWEDLFVHLREACPDLECSRMHQLTYFTHHDRYEENTTPHENVSDVWSTEETDLEELSSLVETLTKKAGGEEFYPEACRLLG
ncbi:unnamed protein product [Clonostachys rosea]|uniref:F-box domain-containing protein n=1 Tax=Bionectria ochroleuca TaxID=29856 RepID=A0ABY6UJD7_BIOOC|nr:unnamed protein product [Clonostachys rosea]